MTRKKTFSIICATIALIVGLLLFWHAFALFLLVFAGILLAVFLQGLSRKISKYGKMPYQLILIAVILTLIIFLTFVIWISTPLIAKQLAQLIEQLPNAYYSMQEILASHIDLKFLTDKDFLKKMLLKDNSLLTHAAEIFSFTLGTIVSFVIFLFIGIYIAFNPQQYIRGFLLLIPSQHRMFIDGVMVKLGKTLRWWIVGKFVAMTAIGILSWIGLWILDVPLAFILGLLAAILTFIPYIGAVIAAIPAILIAFTVSPMKALYVLILYLLIHALEGYCITPIIEQRTVSLPPALTVTVQIVLSLLVGFIGLALASPVTAVIIVLVRELYVKRQSQAKEA